MRTGWLPGHQYGSFVRVLSPGRGSMVHGYAHGPGGGREIGVLTGLPRPGPVVCSLVRLGARAGDLRTEFAKHKKREGRLSPPLISTLPQYGYRIRVFVRCLGNSNQTCIRRASYHSYHTRQLPICVSVLDYPYCFYSVFIRGGFRLPCCWVSRLSRLVAP